MSIWTAFVPASSGASRLARRVPSRLARDEPRRRLAPTLCSRRLPSVSAAWLSAESTGMRSPGEQQRQRHNLGRGGTMSPCHS